MKQYHYLITLGGLSFLAMILLGVMVEQSLHLPSSQALVLSPASMPAPIDPKPITRVTDEPLQTLIVTQEPAVSTMAQVPEQATVPEEIKKPFFYAVQPTDLTKLNEDQQKIYAGTQDEYLVFYKEWMNKWPHDTEAWNNKMTELQQDLANRIGPDGMDNLVR